MNEWMNKDRVRQKMFVPHVGKALYVGVYEIISQQSYETKL